jgi:hypothetical protein
MCKHLLNTNAHLFRISGLNNCSYKFVEVFNK